MSVDVLAWGMPNGFEWIFIAAIGLLLFGKRLPEVGRSLGKGIVEFKKGLKGVESDVASAEPETPAHSPTTVAPAQYKFDPHTGKPIDPALPAGAKFDPYTGKPLEQGSDASGSTPSLESHSHNA